MATTHPPSARDRFSEFFRAVFDPDGLRRFFADFPREDPIADHLTDRASLASLCDEAAEELRRRDAFDLPLFDRLRCEFPRRRAEIDLLERSSGGLRDSVPDRLARYRRRISEEYRHLDVLGADGTGGFEGPEFDLLAAFVPQRVEYGRPRTDRPAAETSSTEAVGAQRPATIDAVLEASASEWLLVLGSQGAGKTTVTQWLMLRLCVDGEYPVTLPPDLVPVRIVLRNFARMHRAVGAQPYDFFDHLAAQSREYNDGLRRDDFSRLAEEGRLYWIFDGIDEILDEEEQVAVFGMILGARNFGGIGVLTSRIAGYESVETRARRAGFRCLTLLPFDDEQVDRFLARWYRVFPSGDDRSGRRREPLSAAIRTNATLHDLSRNPFSLSLMVRYLGDPPYSLHGLLERTTDQILARWDTRRRITGPAQFTRALMRRYLEDLARHMRDRPGGVSNAIAVTDLRRFTRDFCRYHFPDEANVADSIARELLDHLRERTCLLGYTGTDTYGFLQRTFLSFLAASAIYHRLAANDFEGVEALFRRHWHEGDWLQTLVLTCAFLRDEPDRVLRLVRAAIVSAEPRFPFTALDSLAELCIVGLAEVDPVRPGAAHDLAIRINAWLFYAPEWHGIQSRLAQLFATVAGRWPGLAETMELPLAGARRGDFVLPYLCGLADEEMMARVESGLLERRITPFLVHRLQHLHRWRASFTQALQDRAATAKDRSVVLAFALALSDETFFPWSSGLWSAVSRSLGEEYGPMLGSLMAAMDERPATRAGIARTLRLEITVALANYWPELVFSHEFTTDLHMTGQLRSTGLEIVRRAFAAVAESPSPSAGLFHEIVRAQDIPFLAALLDYCGRHPTTAPGLHNALLYQPWEAGLARAISWARDRPAAAELADELTALQALLFPTEDPLFDRVERSLDVFARRDPPEVPTVTWFTSVMSHVVSAHLHDLRAPMQRLLEMGATRYAERALEYRLAVVALLGFGDDLTLAPLIEQASAQRPLLAAFHRQHLVCRGDEPPIPDAATLIADVRGVADERRLLELAQRERWNAFWQQRASPWRALYRHLAEHGSIAAVRMEAAVQLAERDLVARLRTASPEAPELVDMLRFLDARDDLLRMCDPASGSETKPGT